jgi:hypothetical protein
VYPVEHPQIVSLVGEQADEIAELDPVQDEQAMQLGLAEVEVA